MEELYSFICPYCWQRISMMLDLSAGSQSYIEDCEVCCSPIEVSFQVRGGKVVDFDAKASQD